MDLNMNIWRPSQKSNRNNFLMLKTLPVAWHCEIMTKVCRERPRTRGREEHVFHKKISSINAGKKSRYDSQDGRPPG